MKKTILILLFGTTSLVLHSQTREMTETQKIDFFRNMVCQAIPYEKMMSKSGLGGACFYSQSICETQTELYANAPISSIAVKEFPIRFVIFSDDDGSNTISDEFITDHLNNIVNISYLPAKIRFTISEIVRVANTEINHSPFSEWSEDTYFETYAEDQDSQFNVIIVNDFNGGTNGLGNMPFSLDGGTFNELIKGTVVLSSNLIQENLPVNQRQVLAHELGHVFTLHHPFAANLICTDVCREAIDPNGTNGVGLNPYQTGDFLRDTHPMPVVFDLVSSQCEQLIMETFEDDCSNMNFAGMENLGRNIMNYFDCKETFTDEQILKMHCAVENYYEGYYTEPALSVADLNETNLSVYPNPANSVVNIAFSELARNSASIQLWNIMGQVVMKNTIESKKGTINIESLPNGIYLLQITSGDQSTIKKIVKE